MRFSRFVRNCSPVPIYEQALPISTHSRLLIGNQTFCSPVRQHWSCSMCPLHSFSTVSQHWWRERENSISASVLISICFLVTCRSCRKLHGNCQNNWKFTNHIQDHSWGGTMFFRFKKRSSDHNVPGTD